MFGRRPWKVEELRSDNDEQGRYLELEGVASGLVVRHLCNPSVGWRCSFHGLLYLLRVNSPVSRFQRPVHRPLCSLGPDPLIFNDGVSGASCHFSHYRSRLCLPHLATRSSRPSSPGQGRGHRLRAFLLLPRLLPSSSSSTEPPLFFSSASPPSQPDTFRCACSVASLNPGIPPLDFRHFRCRICSPEPGFCCKLFADLQQPTLQSQTVPAP